ncbi:hypothetical protein C2U51_14145 [Enterobacteriaceae bacterium ENNIH1]|nr:hypothetical protein C2U51_14145 [Enterobacteriaceae bacterium ENNIH1]
MVNIQRSQLVVLRIVIVLTLPKDGFLGGLNSLPMTLILFPELGKRLENAKYSTFSMFATGMQRTGCVTIMSAVSEKRKLALKR